MGGIVSIAASLYVLYVFGWKGILFGMVIGIVLTILYVLMTQPSDLSARTGNPSPTHRDHDSAVALIDDHIRTLADKKRQSVRTGTYGEADTRAWEREKRYFINQVIRKQIGQDSSIRDATLSDFIDIKVGSYEGENPDIAQQAAQVDTMSPLQFETHCARILQDHGWRAYTTKASGDQGADVIAERGGMKVVIQCKKYAYPVSNSAVQQVVAAKAFYGASHAAVVTTSAFTKAAHILAQRNGVVLLTEPELPYLGSRLS